MRCLTMKFTNGVGKVVFQRSEIIASTCRGYGAKQYDRARKTLSIAVSGAVVAIIAIGGAAYLIFKKEDK